MSQSINPGWLLSTLEKAGELERLSELSQWLDANLPLPSPKSRKRTITYILSLLELREEGGRLKKQPLLRLFPYLREEKTKWELAYWQVIKNLSYIRDFALFLSQNIEKGEIPRQKAGDFLYSLMGKESPTTFSSLLSILEKFNLVQRERGVILLRYYSPSPLAFSFALCEDMLNKGRVTLELEGLEKEEVLRLFFMSRERALSYLEEERELWQIERRPPLNRVLLLVHSLDEVVDYLKGVKDYERTIY